MTKIKKIVASTIAAISVGAIGLTAFASISSTMTVNGVSVHCEHKVDDMWDYNPFAGDSVTATATAAAALDKITTTATVRYAVGSETRSKTCPPVVKKVATECSAKVTADGLSSSYGAGGWYEGAHNGKSNSTTTSTGGTN